MRLLLIVCLAATMILPLEIQADENVTKPEDSVERQDNANQKPAKASDERQSAFNGQTKQQQEAKQKKALAGFMMLALVCIVFLFFVVAIAVLSSRFRKEVSQPLSKTPQTDPLWYLKNQNEPQMSEPKTSQPND
jgi:hypothetical protein